MGVFLGRRKWKENYCAGGLGRGRRWTEKRGIRGKIHDDTRNNLETLLSFPRFNDTVSHAFGVFGMVLSDIQARGT